MLEAVDNPSSGASTSRRDEAASSSSSTSKVSGEDSQGTSQEKPSKKAKKDKQDKESSGNKKNGFSLIRNMIGLKKTLSKSIVTRSHKTSRASHALHTSYM